MIDIGTRLAGLQREMRELACENETQSASARLIAVSKKQPVAMISRAVDAGHYDFAENYIQEALPKISALSTRPITWHFIGPIQSNKCRDIAENFDWVHSVDRLKVAERLSSLRPEAMPDLNVLLQVNIDNDQNKAGVSRDDALPLAKSIVSLPRLRLRGLMTILRSDTDSHAQRESFAQLRQLKHLLADQLERSLGASSTGFDELSMGMSGDWRHALAEGATMLRIGTAIFGPRSS